jgi:hypothetical protein
MNAGFFVISGKTCPIRIIGLMWRAYPVETREGIHGYPWRSAANNARV